MGLHARPRCGLCSRSGRAEARPGWAMRVDDVPAGAGRLTPDMLRLTLREAESSPQLQHLTDNADKTTAPGVPSRCATRCGWLGCRLLRMTSMHPLLANRMRERGFLSAVIQWQAAPLLAVGAALLLSS